MINYHFVFCPRYRRKIFLIPGVEARFKDLVRDICKQNDIEILAMECHEDHTHLFLSALPQLSIPEIMHLIKKNFSCVKKRIPGTFQNAKSLDKVLLCQHCRKRQF